MPNYNHCTFMGHLTRDAELKYLSNNTAVLEGGIAITTKYAADKERTCFLDFVMFGPRAEKLAQYMTKGAPMLLVGELAYDTWEKDGQRRSKHKLIVNDVQFAGSNTHKGDSGQQQRHDAPTRPADTNAAPARRAPAPASSPISEGPGVPAEDIPF